jgi:hypothetical protein
MSGFADYWENKILDHIFSKGNYTPPTIYIGLLTAEPNDDGSGLAEPSGNSYARVQTSAPDWNAASAGSLDNAGDITFPQATGSWGTITHFALFDAAAGGNLLAYGTLNQSRTIDASDIVQFSSGEMDISLD